MGVELILGKCEKVMATMPDASVDAICTDPPYHLKFMGSEWDAITNGRAMQTWHYTWAVEAFRVLKPGGWIVAFGGTRTYHRLASALEDAGFEIRDSLHWCYGSGFPKSLDVSKAIDAHLGADRTEVLGPKPGHEDFVDRTDPSSAGGRRLGWERPWRDDPEAVARSHMRMAPATPEAATWNGWGTALKPAHEPVLLARKPLVGTVAANVLQHGAGALHIDANRLAYSSDADQAAATPQGRATSKEPSAIGAEPDAARGLDRVEFEPPELTGRWPTNLLMSHDPSCELVGYRTVKSDGHFPAERTASTKITTVGHSGQEGLLEVYVTEQIAEYRCVDGCPVAQLDEQAGERASGTPGTMRMGENRSATYGAESRPPGTPMTGYGDSGTASRFFPVLDWDPDYDGVLFYATKAAGSERSAGVPEGNHHPSVKPVSLMRWLLRLVTPPGGRVLDPFLGSGSTAVAALLEDVELVGIEEKDDYLDVARARVDHADRTIAIHGRHRAPREMFKPAQPDSSGLDEFDLFAG